MRILNDELRRGCGIDPTHRKAVAKGFSRPSERLQKPIGRQLAPLDFMIGSKVPNHRIQRHSLYIYIYRHLGLPIHGLHLAFDHSRRSEQMHLNWVKGKLTPVNPHIAGEIGCP